MPGARFDFSIQGPDGHHARIEARCFETPLDAASAEGTYRLTARSGRLSATMPLRVESPDLSGLIAAQDDPSGGAGGGATAGSASSGRAAGVAAQAEQGRPAWVWVVLMLLAVLFVAVSVAVVVITRRRHRRAEDARKKLRDASLGASRGPGAAPASAPAGGVVPTVTEPLFCPECGTRSDAGQSFCAVHGKPMVPLLQAEVRQRGMICPKCRRGYDAEADFCPHDRAPLIPYPRFQAEFREKTARKTCPQCGTSYPAETTFCGKDGTSLAHPT